MTLIDNTDNIRSNILHACHSFTMEHASSFKSSCNKLLLILSDDRACPLSDPWTPARDQGIDIYIPHASMSADIPLQPVIHRFPFPFSLHLQSTPPPITHPPNYP